MVPLPLLAALPVEGERLSTPPLELVTVRRDPLPCALLLLLLLRRLSYTPFFPPLLVALTPPPDGLPPWAVEPPYVCCCGCPWVCGCCLSSCGPSVGLVARTVRVAVDVSPGEAERWRLTSRCRLCPPDPDPPQLNRRLGRWSVRCCCCCCGSGPRDVPKGAARTAAGPFRGVQAAAHRHDVPCRQVPGDLHPGQLGQGMELLPLTPLLKLLVVKQLGEAHEEAIL